MDIDTRIEQIENDQLTETGAEEFDSELLSADLSAEYDRLLVAREDRLYDPAPDGWDDYELANAAQHAANTFRLEGEL